MADTPFKLPKVIRSYDHLVELASKAGVAVEDLTDSLTIPHPSRTAQKPASVRVENHGGVARGHIEKLLKSVKSTNPVLHGLGEMMLLYGLRVSEVLGVRRCDIKGNGHVLVKGSKGSGDRWCRPMESMAWWQAQRGNDGMVFDGYSRFWVYRQFKSLGIGAVMPGRSKASVTHLPRHVVINELNQDDTEVKDISTFIGHKNSNTTNEYIHDSNVKGETQP